MMKFIALIAIAAFACAQVASAAPIDEEDDLEDFSLASPADNAETAALVGNERIFSDFCQNQRDYVIQDIKTTVRSASADLFTIFFGSYNEISDELVNVEKDAVAKLADQITHPDTPVSEGTMPENEVDALIEKGRKEISQQKDGTYGLIPATKAALGAMYTTLNSALYVRLAKARTYLNAAAFVNAVAANCRKVAEYENAIAANLETTKSELKASAQPEIVQFIETVSVNSLHCQTTKNIVRLNALCELFKDGRGPFWKMFGIGSQ